MKRSFVLLTFAIVSLIVNAQQYPAEWVVYTHSGYLSDIQSDINHDDMPATAFKEGLLGIARTNIAKQVQLRVQDVAKIDKQSNNGQTSVHYASSTLFSTDVDLELVETKTYYNPATKEGFAIAYINKAKARQYYKNELEMLINTIESSVTMARKYIDTGFKEQARKELIKISKQFDKKDKPIFWLNTFEIAAQELLQLQNKITVLDQTVKQMIADLRYATTICLQCNSELLGQNYPAFNGELKGILSTGGCSFTDDITCADFVIKVTATSREGSAMPVGGVTAYFAYVDASITITKMATMQVIYENELTVKGSHTRNYSEAAKSGYKELKKRVTSVIKTHIN